MIPCPNCGSNLYVPPKDCPPSVGVCECGNPYQITDEGTFIPMADWPILEPHRSCTNPDMKTHELMTAHEYEAAGGFVFAVPTCDVTNFCNRMLDRLCDIQNGMPINTVTNEIQTTIKTLTAQSKYQRHEANKWIAQQWMGRKVTEIAGNQRSGTVTDTMWDENGALHCYMDNDWWCPAVKLIPETK